MIMEWRNYNVYYTDIDRLILNCVHPVLERCRGTLDLCFWERHFAGGPHLRVRMRGSAEATAGVGRELIQEAQSFFLAFPSQRSPEYSHELTRRLLALEGEEVQDEDLLYRVDQILERPYDRLHHRLASDEAAGVLESFLHDSEELAVAILSSDSPKMETMLRLYFLEALFVSGSLVRGSVSFKSHWEGFGAVSATRDLNERIEKSYTKNRESIKETMLEVQEEYDNTTPPNPLLSDWLALLDRYRERAASILEAGIHLTHQPSTAEEVRQSWEHLSPRMVRESSFVNAIYKDARFMASAQFEPRLLIPRVLTNLLYSMASLVGLRPLDRMVLCYYAHRAVEEHFGCDLTDVLRETIEQVVNQHAYRLVGQEASPLPA